MKQTLHIILFLSILSTFALRGQSSLQIVDRVSRQMELIDCMELKFEFQGEEGTIIAQKDKFRLTSTYFQIYSNGSDMWVYNLYDEEIVIAHYDSTSTDIIENPLCILHLSDTFNILGEPEYVSESGVACWSVKMEPKEKSNPVSSLKLVVKKDNYTPVIIRYTASDGKSNDIRVISIRKIASKEDGFFILDTSKNEKAFVTDLR